MPFATVDGVRFAYQDVGSGFPLVWCHEFAGTMDSWEAQVRYFSRRYRVITYNARGYPPTDVPADWRTYAHDQQARDLHALLRHLGITQAFVGGLSMGAYKTLTFGMAHPEMCRALIVAGVGTGSTNPEAFKEDAERRAGIIEAGGMRAMESYTSGITRSRYRQKDPAGWRAFHEAFLAHSPLGAANSLRGFMANRPSIFSLEAQLRTLPMPVLLMTGDEDEPCIEPSIFLKRVIPRSGLVMLPQSGHAINIEEPAPFNDAVAEFLAQVEAGRWEPLDPGSGDVWRLERR